MNHRLRTRLCLCTGGGLLIAAAATVGLSDALASREAPRAGENQKCENCGPGPHWVDTCPAGKDVFPSEAVVGLDIDLDCEVDTNLVFLGPVSVARGPGLPHKIQTEMVTMNLTNVLNPSITLIAGAGLGQPPGLPPSPGAILEQVDTVTADSFFDMFFEIHLGGGLYVYNHVSSSVQAKILCVPPNSLYTHIPGCLPLFDRPLGVPGPILVANLITADHQPFPGPMCGDGVVNQPGEQCDPPDDAACPGLCQPDCTCPPPPTGANFYIDPAAFEAALLATDKRAKASWNFKPNNLPAGDFVRLNDPQNIATHAADPDDPWVDPATGADLWPPSVDNVTFLSNLGPHPQPPGPNPHGIDGLVLANAFAPFDNNILVAQFAVDSFDIISGPPAGDNHTAMSIEVLSLFGAGPVQVTVYDKNEQIVGKWKVDVVDGAKTFLGILMKGDLTIGRVNLWDPTNGGEGISKITVYSDSPGILNTDISGPLGAGFPDGCVDAFDLAVVLGAWCSAASDPDPPGDVDPPCEGCASPIFALADLSGPDGAPDGCVDAFDLAKLLANWCSVAGGNPCGTCGP